MSNLKVVVASLIVFGSTTVRADNRTYRAHRADADADGVPAAAPSPPSTPTTSASGSTAAMAYDGPMFGKTKDQFECDFGTDVAHAADAAFGSEGGDAIRTASWVTSCVRAGTTAAAGAVVVGTAVDPALAPMLPGAMERLSEAAQNPQAFGFDCAECVDGFRERVAKQTDLLRLQEQQQELETKLLQSNLEYLSDQLSTPSDTYPDVLTGSLPQVESERLSSGVRIPSAKEIRSASDSTDVIVIPASLE